MILVAAAFAISNGTDAEPGELPAVVAVPTSGSLCSGTLIHPQAVLTAAHCFDGVTLALIPDGDSHVEFGPNVLQPSALVEITAVDLHPGYLSRGFSPNAVGESTSGHPENDIAVVHLASPVPVQPVALNGVPVDDAFRDLPLTMAGFGVTLAQGTGSGVLRSTEVPIAFVEADALLTMGPDGGGTCPADAGGPGFRFVGGEPVQVALISTHGCESSASRHVRIDRYLDFIRDVLPPDEIVVASAAPPEVVCSHQLDDGTSIGTVPTELLCDIATAPGDEVLGVAWDWGDGAAETVVGGRGGHTYGAAGVYTITACIETPRPIGTGVTCIEAVDLVSVCDAPAPSFEATARRGVIAVTNTTPLPAPRCISDVVWEVYEGGSATGSPVATSSEWEPGFDLTDAKGGDYTLVLNVGGFAGAGAASTTVKVRRGLACASTPTGAGFLAPLLLGLLRRRSRAHRCS